MAMLDRYRRRGGFVQLLNLIESSSTQKRENFLGLIAQESKIWEEEIRKRILSFQRILTWNPQYLSEIFTRVQPLTMAIAFFNSPPEEVTSAFSGLSPSLTKKIELLHSELNPSPAEIFTCQVKIIEETRQLIQKSILKLEKVDPELFIHEKIEEVLAEKESNSPFSEIKNQQFNLEKVQTQSETNSISNSQNSAAESEEDLKKVQELSTEFQNAISKKADNDQLLKQLHQEFVGIRGKFERLQHENTSLKKELEGLKAHENKFKEEITFLRKENQTSKTEAQTYKSKLEQIKKIA